MASEMEPPLASEVAQPSQRLPEHLHQPQQPPEG